MNTTMADIRVLMLLYAAGLGLCLFLEYIHQNMGLIGMIILTFSVYVDYNKLREEDRI